MSLTNYQSKIPVLSSPLSSGGYQGTLASYNVGIPLIQPGDTIVAVFMAESGADPTSVTLGAIGNMTKQTSNGGFSIWTAVNALGYALINTSAYATFAVATRTLGVATSVSNAKAGTISGAIQTQAATARDTDIKATFLTNTTSAVLWLTFQGVIRSSASTPGVALALSHATPGSLAAQQISINAPGVSKGIGMYACCNNNEDVQANALPGTNGVYTQFSDANGSVLSYGYDIGFYGLDIALDDLTYKVDNGPLLNSSATIPFYDIDSVAGLTDMNITNDSSAVDGTEGSYVAGKFVSGKTIVVAGKIVSASLPGFDETLVDSFKASLQPNTSGSSRFYYKGNNVAPRVIDVIPINFTADIDRARASAQCPFQVQFLTQQANGRSLLPVGYNWYTSSGITPGGNTDTYPLFYFNLYAADIVAGNYWQFTNKTYDVLRRSAQVAGQSIGVTITTAGAPTGVYKLDLRAKMLWYLTATGWTDVSNLITERNWWSLIPNIANGVSMGTHTGVWAETPTLVAWDQWR